MKYKQLGESDLKVSLICLGTMTFGEQNTQKDAFEQMDYSLEQGVNFFDTAEMYAVPPKESTCGATEIMVGNWFEERKNRKKVILATKVAGPGLSYIRGGSKLTKEHITEAVEGSLKRLKTDYIDLYQIHWPTRKTNYFENLDFSPSEAESETPTILESLEAISGLVKQGKVRYIGVSNETAWGVSQFLKFAKERNLEKIISIQNPYHLLNRSYEIGLSEFSYRDKVDLLAYSPLAFGVLSGKYLGGKMPENTRFGLFPFFRRYLESTGLQMTEKYCKLAKEYGLDPAQMALAFVNGRFFMGSNIIGATTMEQLKMNIASVDIELPKDLLNKINEEHKRIPNPAQ